MHCLCTILGISTNSNLITLYNVGSVLRRLFSTAEDCIITCEDSISTAEAVQYNSISTMGDSISTVEE